ncbi:MAG: hypothetical protein K2X87_09850 [Gemmataceae bacterium]|nr:hypothetical protein [Gemmataceae bacterium]
MTRLVLAVLVPVAVLAAAPAAPFPTHLMRPDPAEYYPTTVGARLVYATNVPGLDVTLVVTGVERVAGGKLVTTALVSPAGETTLYQKVKVTARGLFLANPDGHDFEPPRCFLELPPKAGSRWPFRFGGVEVDATMSAGGVEEVEVPAGKFRAARVAVECEGVPFVSWYAPTVGVVRADVSGGTGLALKSYTPGRP